MGVCAGESEEGEGDERQSAAAVCARGRHCWRTLSTVKSMTALAGMERSRQGATPLYSRPMPPATGRQVNESSKIKPCFHCRGAPSAYNAPAAPRYELGYLRFDLFISSHCESRHQLIEDENRTPDRKKCEKIACMADLMTSRG